MWGGRPGARPPGRAAAGTASGARGAGRPALCLPRRCRCPDHAQHALPSPPLPSPTLCHRLPAFIAYLCLPRVPLCRARPRWTRGKAAARRSGRPPRAPCWQRRASSTPEAAQAGVEPHANARPAPPSGRTAVAGALPCSPAGRALRSRAEPVRSKIELGSCRQQHRQQRQQQQMRMTQQTDRLVLTSVVLHPAIPPSHICCTVRFSALCVKKSR